MKKQFPLDIELSVVEMRQNNVSKRVIADELGINWERVEDILKAYGEVPRVTLADRWPLIRLIEIVCECENWAVFREDWSDAYQAAGKLGHIGILKEIFNNK